MNSRRTYSVVALFALALPGCGGGDPSNTAAAASSPWPESYTADSDSPEMEHFAADPVIELARTPWKGDLDGMIERRMVRVLVVPGRTHYWLELGRHSGIEWELAKAFEVWLSQRNRQIKKHLRPHVVFVPTTGDRLIPDLLAGKGDIAAAMLTVTERRATQVDFSAPYAKDVKEVVVTGPGAEPFDTMDDLSGRKVFVRKSSSYHTHLKLLNKRFELSGRPLAKLVPVPEFLTDNDILEMVNAGLLGTTVVDFYEARIWRQAFKDLEVHEDVPVNEGGELAWMIRKRSPKLSAELAAFMAKHRQGTSFGNTVANKYVGSNRFVRRATSTQESAKLLEVRGIFEKYSDQYDVDWVLMAAQGYQESRLSQRARSPVGAVGIMQLMPATARSLGVGDIKTLDSNIHAGVKYSSQIRRQYFEDEPMDDLNKGLFTVAAYNAGPGRIGRLRRLAEKRGLDPNVWFGNVEVVAAEKIGSETVTYVSNTFKYYVAFKLMMRQVDEGDRFKIRMQGPGAST